MDAPLDRFRRVVLADPGLRATLMAEADPRRFAVQVVALAHREGIDVSFVDVQASLVDARRRRSARWV